MTTRLEAHVKGLLDHAVKIVPLSGLILIVSYWAAKQIVTPHHRMIKMGVLGTVLVIMFRFDVLYSLILFTFLFPYPSGITIGSSNTVLLFLIGLTWAIRATSTEQRIHVPSRYDWPIVVLLIAYILSFYNCETTLQVRNGINVLMKQSAAIIYFYLVIRFVNDERRLNLYTKVVGISICIVTLTGVIELFFPGTQIIPGWIGLPKTRGEGILTARVAGVRLHGAVGGHNILSDMAMVGMFYIVYHMSRARNPLGRVLWLVGAVMSTMVLMGTANRGATISLILGALYTLYRFRRRVALVTLVIICATTLAVLIGAQLLLEEYTNAVSVYDRLITTKFVGFEPDTRAGIWRHTFTRSLEHPFVGHGPWYDPGIGLDFQLWPHNAYLFYFYTIGLLGLSAFLWMAFLVVRRSMIFRNPSTWKTPMGDFATIMHIQVCVLLFSQIRTDHQRDETHIYLIWMVFGLVAATAKIIDRQRAAAKADP